MTYLTGSFVSVRIAARSSLAVSFPKLPSASALADVSMTATPSSPMTNPVLAPAGIFDLGLEIAAQTFGPTCLSKKDGSVAIWARGAPDMHRRRMQGRNRRLFIVQLLRVGA